MHWKREPSTGTDTPGVVTVVIAVLLCGQPPGTGTTSLLRQVPSSRDGSTALSQRRAAFPSSVGLFAAEDTLGTEQTSLRAFCDQRKRT